MKVTFLTSDLTTALKTAHGWLLEHRESLCFYWGFGTALTIIRLTVRFLSALTTFDEFCVTSFRFRAVERETVLL